jgi:hypothetical protein
VKTILTAALALAALASSALANEAVELTDAQMDKITAGQGGNARINSPRDVQTGLPTGRQLPSNPTGKVSYFTP